MKKPYPDHSWFREMTGGLHIPHASTGRTPHSCCIWLCMRCGVRITVAGNQHPTFQNQIDQGVHLNCDVVLVTRVMLS